MNKIDQNIYRVVTLLFSLAIMMGVGMYLLKHDMVAEMFTSLKYPVYLIYPLALVKTLGIIAIWSNQSKTLKEWAYAGFVFELSLAASAHMNVQDGGYFPPLVLLVLLGVSYFYYRKMEREGSPA